MRNLTRFPSAITLAIEKAGFKKQARQKISDGDLTSSPSRPMLLNAQIDAEAAREIVTLNGAANPFGRYADGQSHYGWLTPATRATADRFRVSRRSLARWLLQRFSSRQWKSDDCRFV
jgi:hypothetical protein